MSNKFARLIVGTACVCCFSMVLVGCTSSNEPTAPEAGVMQEYLDENPEAAARLNEGADQDSADQDASDNAVD